MSIDLIREWYNGSRNYIVGVRLYEQHGGDPDLLQLMKKGATDFTRGRLMEELLRIFRGDQPAEQDTAPPAPYEFPTYGPKDPVLLELYMKKVDLQKAKDILRHQLEGYGSDNERGVAAHQILSIRDEISRIWVKEAYYKEHKRLPTEPGRRVTNPSMLQHRRTIVNGNIRRLRGLLKKDPDNIGYQRSFEKFQAEYAHLKEMIKKHGKATFG